MSAGQLPGAGGPNSDQCDINITPIIDSFVVLIAFMLMSASFLSIGLLDAGVSAPGVPDPNSKPPSVQLQIKLNPKHQIELKLMGKENKTWTLPAKDDQWDLAALSQALTQTKSKFSDLSALTLSADDRIEYTDVILSMNEVRKVIPVVLLGGF